MSLQDEFNFLLDAGMFEEDILSQSLQESLEHASLEKEFSRRRQAQIRALREEQDKEFQESLKEDSKRNSDSKNVTESTAPPDDEEEDTVPNTLEELRNARLKFFESKKP